MSINSKKPKYKYRLGFAKKKYKRLKWFYKLPEDKKFWLELNSGEVVLRIVKSGEWLKWKLNIFIDQELIWKMEQAMLFGTRNKRGKTQGLKTFIKGGKDGY